MLPLLLIDGPEYNCSKYQDEATASDYTSDVQVEVIKHVKASPLKSKKLSRHQKYRQLMLHCQELSDVSSDLPIRDYQMIVRFIKGVTCTVHNGKSLIVKELSETLGSNRQVEENHVGEDMEFDPPLTLSNDFGVKESPQQDHRSIDQSEGNNEDKLSGNLDDN